MAKQPVKKQSVFSSFLKKLNPNSPKKQFLAFILVFMLIGGGYYAYRSFAATPRRIIIVGSNNQGVNNLFSINSDGTSPIKLTSNTTKPSDPTHCDYNNIQTTQAGDKVFFIKWCFTTATNKSVSDLWRINSDGTGLTKIAGLIPTMAFPSVGGASPDPNSYKITPAGLAVYFIDLSQQKIIRYSVNDLNTAPVVVFDGTASGSMVRDLNFKYDSSGVIFTRSDKQTAANTTTWPTKPMSLCTIPMLGGSISCSYTSVKNSAYNNGRFYVVPSNNRVAFSEMTAPGSSREDIMGSDGKTPMYVNPSFNLNNSSFKSNGVAVAYNNNGQTWVTTTTSNTSRALPLPANTQTTTFTNAIYLQDNTTVVAAVGPTNVFASQGNQLVWINTDTNQITKTLSTLGLDPTAPTDTIHVGLHNLTTNSASPDNGLY